MRAWPASSSTCRRPRPRTSCRCWTAARRSRARPGPELTAVETLSAPEARRIALAAQGFGGARPPARPGAAGLLAAVGRLGLLQIDSVNVLVRAQYLPLFSRLGAYNPALLDRLAYEDRALFEYWGHEASLLPVSAYPLLRWRMERAARGLGVYGHIARFGRRRRAFVQEVLAEVTARGPLAASELSRGGRASGPWWGRSVGKKALEWLFWTGQVTTATRRRFERVYDLPERVLPAAVLGAPAPGVEEAQRALLRKASAALGIATARDLADYFRLSLTEARPRLAEMVEAGALVPARVAGWREAAYLHPGAPSPRRVQACALLAPFDPLVWERQRTERIFGFHYRISIYTPAAMRQHGYYVLPFLLGDRLVARVDLKADRAARVLRVPASHLEPGASAGRVARALARELATMAEWLGLDGVQVGHRGNLGRALRAASGSSRPFPLSPRGRGLRRGPSE